MTLRTYLPASWFRALPALAAVIALVASLFASSACGRRATPERDTSQPSAASPAGRAPVGRFPAQTGGHTDEAPLSYLSFTLGGASERDKLPLVIAIHGLGDTPQNFSQWLLGLDLRVRLIVPQAPTAYGHGYSWFAYREGRTEHELAVGISKSRDRLERLLDVLAKRFPSRGKPAVLGFSQGGMLSFALAAHAPERLSLVMPLGGLLPSELEPPLMAAPGSRPEVLAFHGTKDPVVPFSGAKHATDRLSSLGYEARLVSYAGVGHQIPPRMREAVFQKLREWSSK